MIHLIHDLVRSVVNGSKGYCYGEERNFGKRLKRRGWRRGAPCPVGLPGQRARGSGERRRGERTGAEETAVRRRTAVGALKSYWHVLHLAELK